jgi:hypothetical protein
MVAPSGRAAYARASASHAAGQEDNVRYRMTILGVAATLLALFVIGTGCNGGGGALTLEEYFAELQRLDDEESARSDELDQQIEEETDGLTDEAEVIEIFKGYLPQFRESLERFVSNLGDLNPPDEAQEAHNEAVAAGEDFIDAFDAASGEIEDAQTFAEFGEIFEGGEVSAAGDRFTDACLDLEQIAADNNIDVDLDCDDEEAA